MKRLLSYLIGWNPKPKSPQSRVLAAHEVALKQAVARRRSKQSMNDSAGGRSGDPRLSAAAEGASPDGEVLRSDDRGNMQPQPVRKREQMLTGTTLQAGEGDSDSAPGRKKKRRKKRS